MNRQRPRTSPATAASQPLTDRPETTGATAGTTGGAIGGKGAGGAANGAAPVDGGRPKAANAGLLNTRSLADQLFYLLRARIVSGELAHGEPIRQDTLAAEFGISKIPLREALARLEQDGLVASYVNRGFVVTAMTLAEADEVFTLRAKLEPDAAVAGCMQATEADHHRAREAFAAFSTAPVGERAERNRAFHLSLIRPGVGELTYRLVERLNVIAERYVLFHLAPPSRPQTANAEHQNLLDLWLNRQEHDLASFARTHIEATHQDLLRDMQARIATTAR
ncbi:GntR family transcriptional regulator [Acetobacter sp. TBRC 12305]|uniref:GntR family transcriptional regulator n=1 Tax=Acetobacter garciniae TaxID=2817435 RepID=A0A939HQ14_9PROT|nr:GntR family transcriptional regulator [Acetobacter garciniae]MBO1326129.1 GntR family transcriptional regulator [Acetobacter garciniae]MBX0345127.1 GntR family transcriptional regulator [Acetobacter garciniae]